jgi:predicted dehydrogenase
MRIGLVGAGFIGRMHAQVARSVHGVAMVGYVDPNAKANHPDLAGLKRYAALPEMLGDAIDGVIIAVPDELHVSTAMQCLAQGVAVLLEKPAARSLEECLELSRAPGAGDRLIVGHQRRHHPASRFVKAQIEKGTLGRLIGIGGVFAMKKDDKYFVERPRGVGLVNLIHDLDLLQYYCGRITQVSAAVSHKARAAREEDTIALTLEFDSGVVGSFIASDSSPSPWGWDQATTELPSIPYTELGTTYMLLGSDGSLSIPDLNLFKHRKGEAWHHALVHENHRATGGNAYANQIAHFADVMAGKAKPVCGIADAVATQATLDAVFLSARDGRRVSTEALVKAAGGSV